MATIDENTIQRFTADIASKGRVPATIESYRRDCLAFLKFFNEAGVAVEDLEPSILLEFQNYLRSKNIKDNSIRRSVIGIRQFFRYIQTERGWNASPFDESIIPKRNDHFDPRIDAKKFELLKSALVDEGSTLKKHRDLALLMLLGIEGLKVAELIGLSWRDFFGSTATGTLRIKGNRDRTIQLEHETTEALMLYRNQVSVFSKHGSLDPKAKIMIGFKGVDASHSLSHLTRHGVKFALYELGNRVKINFLNSEDLRHHAMAHKVSLGFTPEMLMVHLGLRTPGKAVLHFKIDSGE
jgi:integrase/recombinase XerD